MLRQTILFQVKWKGLFFDDMVAKLLKIDIVFIIITGVIFLYYNFKPCYGLEALEAVGRAAFCLIALLIETVTLVILLIIKKQEY